MPYYSDYLTDCGLSKQFVLTAEVLRKPLSKTVSISSQVCNERELLNALRKLSSSNGQLEFVMAGWIDQAKLEVVLSRIGNKDTLKEISCVIDEYRPDQNGDIGLYIASQNWLEVLEIIISRDDNSVGVSVYRKICENETC